MTTDFFLQQEEHTKVKSAIVAKYFPTWATIVGSLLKDEGMLLYLDLFSGPGRFGETHGSGEESTPLLITRRVVDNPRLMSRVKLVFNDKDEGVAKRLREELDQLPGLDQLSHRPEVYSTEIAGNLNDLIFETRLCPTFSFLDPFGYKGLSQELIRRLVGGKGCECVFFFNDSAIRRAISNPRVELPMAEFFGKDRALRLRSTLSSLRHRDRGGAMMKALEETLQEAGATFVIPFVLRPATRPGCLYHLVFASKHVKGYMIMKEIMRGLGTARFISHDFSEIAFEDQPNPRLFEEQLGPELVSLLPCAFAGQSLTVKEIIGRHHIGTPFIEKDYRDALCTLENEGKISVQPAPGRKRKGKSFAPHLIICFPPLEGGDGRIKPD